MVCPTSGREWVLTVRFPRKTLPVSIRPFPPVKPFFGHYDTLRLAKPNRRSYRTSVSQYPDAIPVIGQAPKNELRVTEGVRSSPYTDGLQTGPESPHFLD